jgi:hypothetical protein
MRFQELREYYEASDDQLSIAKIDDTRRARLTLKHLNKLRKKREMERLEHEVRVKDFSDMYGRTAE